MMTPDVPGAGPGVPTDPLDLADALWLAALADELPRAVAREAWPDSADWSGMGVADAGATEAPEGADERADRTGHDEDSSPRGRQPESVAQPPPGLGGPAGGPGGALRGRGARAGPRPRRRHGSWAAPAPPTLAALVGQWRELRLALEGLRQSVPSVWEVVLDDEATARHLADGRWRPVYRPVRERRWSLTLVVDDNWTMAIWQGLVPRLVALLERLGVFQDVRVYFLGTDADDATALRLRGSKAAAVGFSPARLLEPPGRRFIWVLTDGMGTAWRRGLAGPVLWSWARRLPVAVLGAVPRSTLRHTGLDEYQGLLPSPGSGAIAVPMLDPHPVALGRWADRMASRDGGRGDLPAMLVWPAPPGDDQAGAGEPDGGQPASAHRQVDQFRSAASPAAFDLATHLAAAPITRSTLRLLLGMVEGPPGHALGALSELFAHSLLFPVGGVVDDSAILYDFVPGLRERLLAYTRRAQTLRVLQAVSAELGPKVNAVRHLGGALADPDAAPIPAVTPETEDFVAVEAAAFGALSGRYLPRARRLQESLRVPAATPRRRTPAVWGNVPRRNPDFVGREEHLEELRRRLNEGTTALLPEALHGLGGVGKTQLAIEYVWRFAHLYDVVWWISAESTAQMAASLVQLAPRLGLQVGTEANSAVPAVLEALRRGQPYDRWLLVFDSADDVRSVQEYFPMGAAGRILVTSRNARWTEVANSVQVAVFTRAESVEALSRRLPRPENVYPDGSGPNTSDLVADALGDLPLAVEQAAAWMAVTGMPATEYLRMFADRRDELLRASPPADYALPVQAAWSLSLDRLAEVSPAAARLLEVCAFYGQDSISREIFERGREVTVVPELDAVMHDPDLLSQAIREISRYSLAAVDREARSIQMSRLVQAVVIARMSDGDREATQRAAQVLLAASDPGEPDDPTTWPAYADLYPHVVASQAASSLDPRVRELVVKEIVYLYHWGDRSRSLELAGSTYETWQRSSGEKGPGVLRLAVWLGRLYFAVGRYADAARTNSRSLELSTREYGIDHPETLVLMGNGVADRIAAGDFQGCLELAERRFRLAERIVGADAAEALLAAHDVGGALRLVGRYAEARSLDEQTWTRRVRLLGERGLDTLRSLMAIALADRELGDYLGARARLEIVVNQMTEAVGDRRDHFQVLMARGQLAVALREAGLHEEALDMARGVESMLVRLYGNDDPRAMAASLALATDLRHCGMLAEAIELGEQALARYQRVFGETHPYTSAAAVNLAIALRLSGHIERARDLDAPAVDVLADRLGQDHPYTLIAATNLASDLYAAGEFEMARERDTDTFARSQRVLVDQHPSTLLLGANLALDLRALGRSLESRELATRMTDGLHRALGVDHPATRHATGRVRADFDIDPEPL